MSDITISYKGSSIATMDDTGTKTLLTEGKYCEDDITIDYVKSGGGGGGLTKVASGTYTGTGATTNGVIPPQTGFFVGTKMPKTDFWFKFIAKSDSEFSYDTNYKYAYGLSVIFSEIGHFDLSSNGDSKQMESDLSYDINNNGTITSATAGAPIKFTTTVRNGTASSTSVPNNFRIDRTSSGFYVRLYNSNAVNLFPSGMVYDWEVVYFGSNPSTDIIEV